MDSERTGSPGGRVCETLRGLRSVFCSQSAGYGRAEHMCSRGEPLGVRGLLWMRRVTSWLHVWFGSGRRMNPCRMVPSKRDEVREQLHDVTGKVRRLRVAALVLRI